MRQEGFGSGLNDILVFSYENSDGHFFVLGDANPKKKKKVNPKILLGAVGWSTTKNKQQPTTNKTNKQQEQKKRQPNTRHDKIHLFVEERTTESE